MFLLNTTLIADNAVNHDWLQWAQETLVPRILAAGNFSSARFLRVIDSPNEGTTYCMQFFADTRAQADNYLSSVYPDVQGEIALKFGQGVLLFTTLMEFID